MVFIEHWLTLQEQQDEEAFICNANSIWVPGQPGFLGRWGLGARKLALSMIILQTLAGQVYVRYDETHRKYLPY